MAYTLTNDEQRAVHEALLRDYEREHLKRAMQLRAAEQDGTVPQEVEGLGVEVGKLDLLIAVHRQELQGLGNPASASRVVRREQRKGGKG